MATDIKSKLYLNMILKEDEPTELVSRSIGSVKDYVDGIYITITYKDTLPESSPLIDLLNEMGAYISYFKWINDFSAARNFALSFVPKGEDCYFYWQDADDVLLHPEKLHQLADEAYAMNAAAFYLRYLYHCDLDEDGNIKEVIIEHKRERIVRNDDTFKWVGMLHETMIEQKAENVLKILRKECEVLHLSNNERYDKNLERNQKILEEQYRKEEGRDPRTLVYLAKTYYDKSRTVEDEGEKRMYQNKALVLFHAYLEGVGTPGTEEYKEGSGFAEERAQAWAHVSEIAVLQDNLEIALNSIDSAIAEAPNYPNYYVDKAMIYLMLGDFSKAKTWLLLGTSLPMPETSGPLNPRDLKTRALECAYQIHFHDKKIDDCLLDAEELLELRPDSELYQMRVKEIKEWDKNNRASQSIVFLGKYLEQKGEKEKLEHLVQAIPSELEDELFAFEMRHEFLPAREWAEDEIAIVCGPGFEKWSPKSITKGIGGSEEAVIYLSQELRKLGWKVTVYADPGEEAGDHDGVTYLPYRAINTKDQFNVLILWRSVGFVDIEPKARFTMLWMHDIPNNPDFTEERLEKIDKIAVLTEFHQSLFRMHKKDGSYVEIPQSKFFLTANGVPPLNPKKWKGNPYRMIYSSSPDRGLPYLLNNWEKIKKAVPEAELHVFYGFQTFDAIYKNNPGRMKWKEKILDLMKQEGITYHGRVGHKELAKEMAKSGIWAYPTDFEEISCITAMKAQILGAIPVCTNFAALQETVKNGLKVDVDITTLEGQEEYFNSLIKLLKDHKLQKEIREPMMKWAKDYFGWNIVAGNWDELFRRKLQNPEIPEVKPVEEKEV